MPTLRSLSELCMLLAVLLLGLVPAKDSPRVRTRRLHTNIYFHILIYKHKNTTSNLYEIMEDKNDNSMKFTFNR